MGFDAITSSLAVPRSSSVGKKAAAGVADSGAAGQEPSGKEAAKAGSGDESGLFISPVLRYDQGARVAVLYFRDFDTGETRDQIPAERVVEKYRQTAGKAGQAADGAAESAAGGQANSPEGAASTGFSGGASSASSSPTASSSGAASSGQAGVPSAAGSPPPPSGGGYSASGITPSAAGSSSASGARVSFSV